MEFIIISGLSGAGKSKVASFLEDIGFYVVDNMPAPLMPKFAELCMAGPGRYDRVALVTDIRGGQTFDGLFDALHELHRMGCAYKILFVEASVETIIKRYKETRRMHPLSSTSRSLDEAVRQERTVLAPVRQRAEYIIDTSALSTAKLRGEVLRLFGDGGSTPAMSVSVISFGFKYGIPIEADLVFDVRFLPNPYSSPSCAIRPGWTRGYTALSLAISRPRTLWPTWRASSASSCPSMWRRERRRWSSASAAPAGSTARWPLPRPWPTSSSRRAIRPRRTTGT